MKKISAKCLVTLKDGDPNVVMCVLDDMGDKVLVRVSGDKYKHAVYKKKDLQRLF
jgi:hypothetical protein